MRNHEVTAIQPLLKDDGSLREPGWSRKPVQVYDRNKIKVPALKIKEWDYYIAISEKGEFGVAMTISDDGYIALQSVTLFDFKKKWEHTETIVKAFPLGKFKLPSSSSNGSTVYHDKRLDMEFIVSEGKRSLSCNFKSFFEGKDFSCELELEQPRMDTMVIATPWAENPKAFYYNQKINCMRVSGKAVFDGREYVFDPSTDFATLDWGRGVWTYKNTWYWGSGNGIVGGKPLGFNIGYGFGDTKAASENILIYDSKCHKLDDVTFNIPAEGYMKPWKFTSSDGRFETDFVPILDRAAKIDLKVITTDQHQVFGRMTGKVILDDGTALEFKDLLCFAEHVYMKY